MYEFNSKIIDIIQRTPSVKSFRFEIPEEMDYLPGQYLALTINVNGEEKTKPFSISNAPTEKEYIEFTKRLTDSDFSQVLKSLKVGDLGHLRLPFGKFTFSGEVPKIALLSGGIGITPFRNICKNASDKKLESDIILVYGNRSPDEIVFKEDFDDMSKANDKFRTIYCLTDMPTQEVGDMCRLGFIDEVLIKKEILDFAERVFYVCGPPGMVQCLCDVLKDKLGLPEDKIIVEKFMGYE